MAILLDTLELPGDLLWEDEYGWTPVEQSFTYGVDGELIVQAGARLAGRPITLRSGQNMAWIGRALAESLRATLADPGRTFNLEIHGRFWTVVWDHAAGGLELGPVLHWMPVDDDLRYFGGFHFREVVL